MKNFRPCVAAHPRTTKPPTRPRAQYKVLFPHLRELLCEARAAQTPSNEASPDAAATRYGGCRLLDLLYERAAACGSPAVRVVLETLFQAVATSVLYRQLYAWMVHGRIVDYHDEFFIAAPPGPAGRATDAGRTDNRWEAGCVLQMDRVPCFLGTTTAASILFVGKAVATLAQSGPAAAGSTGLPVQALFAKPLRLPDFQGAVMAARSTAAARLWAVVMVDEQLARMLALLRAHLLLGRGELLCPSCAASNV